MSEASRTFGRVSGNIANPSKSENCQGNFQDLQKDLVVLRDLMLLLTSPSAYASTSPERRGFFWVGVGASTTRVFSAILHKGSPRRRAGCVTA